MNETKAEPGIAKFGVSHFVLLAMGTISVIFLVAIGYSVWMFQNTTKVVAQKGIADQVRDANIVLTQVFDRYTLLGQQLVVDPKLIELVDNPGTTVDANRVLIAPKVSFAIDEMFVLSQKQEILFQNSTSTTLLTSEVFKNVAAGAFETKVRRGFFLDSSTKKPVFYLVFPIQGEKETGILVMGKVMDEAYLATIFPSTQKGIMIFSSINNQEVISANVEIGTMNKILQMIKPEKEIDYQVETQDFTGSVRVSDLR